MPGIKTIVLKPLTSNSRADGRFDKRDFIYDDGSDSYRCPAGERDLALLYGRRRHDAAQVLVGGVPEMLNAQRLHHVNVPAHRPMGP